MTKPLKIKKSRRSITLPDALLEKIRDRAKRFQVSENDIIETILRIDFGLNVERGGAS